MAFGDISPYLWNARKRNLLQLEIVRNKFDQSQNKFKIVSTSCYSEYLRTPEKRTGIKMLNVIQASSY